MIPTTGAGFPEYTHTQFKGVPSLEKTAPEALAEIHPETAAKYGLSDVPHGWAKANSNLLTELDHRDPVTGYTEMKALLCSIKKVE